MKSPQSVVKKKAWRNERLRQSHGSPAGTRQGRLRQARPEVGGWTAIPDGFIIGALGDRNARTHHVELILETEVHDQKPTRKTLPACGNRRAAHRMGPIRQPTERNSLLSNRQHLPYAHGHGNAGSQVAVPRLQPVHPPPALAYGGAQAQRRPRASDWPRFVADCTRTTSQCGGIGRSGKCW